MEDIAAQDGLLAAKAYASFKIVRNRLRKYFPEDIVLACVAELNNKSRDRLERLRQFPPWMLLLLAKWALLHGDYLSPNRRHLATNEFNSLINLMHDFGGAARLPSDYAHWWLFLRNVAFQQFWLQIPPNGGTLARQNDIFCRLPENHEFQTSFKAKTGLSICAFVDLSFLLLTRVLTSNEPFVEKTWFAPIAGLYPPEVVDRFLALISADFSSLSRMVGQLENQSRSMLYEYYERTPLLRSPLLRIAQRYYPIAPEVLFRCLETFVYDSLRDIDPEKFMQRFGAVFERYVRKTLEYMHPDVITEKRLEEVLPGTGKVVDFSLLEKDTILLVDAKGVEMHYLGMIGHRPEIVRDKTKASVIKGIQQGFETAIRLRQLGELNGVRIDEAKLFLMIVTFKDLYLGNGLDFYESVAKETLDALASKYRELPIPYEHMYFVSIDDLDLFSECVRRGPESWSQRILMARGADAVGQTKKFTFGQHIKDWCPDVGLSSRVNKEFDAVIGRLAPFLK